MVASSDNCYSFIILVTNKASQRLQHLVWVGKAFLHFIFLIIFIIF